MLDSRKIIITENKDRVVNNHVKYIQQIHNRFDPNFKISVSPGTIQYIGTPFRLIRVLSVISK